MKAKLLHLAAVPLALFLMLPDASTAAAQPPTLPPAGNSAIGQYLEMVPTATGGKASRNARTHTGSSHTAGGGTGFGGGPSGGGGGGPISPSTARSMSSRGPTGALAANVALATAPQSGRRHSSKADATTSKAGAVGNAGSPPSPTSSVLRAITGSSSGGGLGTLLPILLVVILLGGGAIALLRRRAKAEPPSA
jgi:hypothetical protein